MIRLRNVTKTYATKGSRHLILQNVSVAFPDGRSVGVLGRNGAGKSTLLRLISGTIDPDHGHIDRSGKVSWPLGFSGSFHPALTGAQNTRFVARIYGVDTDALISFVDDFAELGVFLHAPVATYSSGMKARLAFGVSMGVAFDTYLVDEITAVGDASFRKKCQRVLEARLSQARVVMVSHSVGTIRSFCEAGAVLEGGALTYFENVEDAIAQHEANMAAA